MNDGAPVMLDEEPECGCQTCGHVDGHASWCLDEQDRADERAAKRVDFHRGEA